MKKLLIRIIFYLHLIIFILFPLGFLIPSSIFPNRIEYHFYFTLSLFILFYLWGSIWTLKFKDKIYSVCILDTLMQKLRGYSIWDKKNYEHSFIVELSTKFTTLKIHKKIIPRLLLACVIISATLYILKIYK